MASSVLDLMKSDDDHNSSDFQYHSVLIAFLNIFETKRYTPIFYYR